MFTDPSSAIYLCGDCRVTPRPWDGFYFYGAYDGILRQLILEYKFGGRLGRGRLLQRLAKAACLNGGWRGCEAESGDWLVVPIPLHVRRLRERGFNQSLEMARGIVRYSGRLAPEALIRHVETAPQVELSAQERQKNVRGAFVAERSIVSGKQILLVDDIMTTGGTLEAATRALRRAGAAIVDILVLARTPKS